MSMLTTYPLALAGPALAVARPLFGAGLLVALGTVFKPLLLGVVRAVQLVFSPRLTLEQRRGRQTLHRVLMLNSLAREFDRYEPNQAAELRMLATRD
ncbi:MAG: hypothetical protein JO269_07330 [Burkholderiaceae bacterium]|nr:hypothetical protein [Burkholderiaceae bacterium]